MKRILAKALLFLSVLSIGVAAVPDKQFSLDVQNSTQTWELKWIYTGTTPLLRGMLTKNGTEWKPSSDWAGFFWYGTNSSWGSGGTTKLAGTFSTNNAYIDFQAISTTFPTSGLFYGGVVMTNGTQSIEWGVGKVFVRDSGGISGAGTLSLKETVNWDLIDTYTGTWPFYFNYADADTNGFSSTTYPTGVVITARFSTNSNVTGYSNFVESTYYPRSNPSNFLNSGSAGLLYDALGAAAGASNGVVAQIVSSNYYPSSNPSNFISTDATNSLPNYLLRSGANAMTGKLNMGGNDITNCTGLFLGSAGWYIYAGNMQDEPYWSDGFVLERMWTSGNGGSGSGLDADTVDGVHAASFLPLAGGTMTGPLVGITSQLYRVTGYAGGTTVAVTDYGSSLDMYPGGDGFAGGSVRLWNDHPQNSPSAPIVSLAYKSTNLVVNGTIQEAGSLLSAKYAPKTQTWPMDCNATLLPTNVMPWVVASWGPFDNDVTLTKLYAKVMVGSETAMVHVCEMATNATTYTTNNSVTATTAGVYDFTFGDATLGAGNTLFFLLDGTAYSPLASNINVHIDGTRTYVNP